MWRWWAELTMRSRIDSATTGFGNSEYQSAAWRLAVEMAGLAPLSVMPHTGRRPGRG
jgi:hypothetical protein